MFYKLFTSRQVKIFKNYKNPSSTSKVINKTKLHFWMNLFSICIWFEFQANWNFWWIHDSNAFMSHIWIWITWECNWIHCHIIPHQIISQVTNANPNANPKNECDCHETFVNEWNSHTCHVRHIFMPVDQIINKIYLQCNNLLNENNSIQRVLTKNNQMRTVWLLKTNSILFLVDLVYILVQNWKFSWCILKRAIHYIFS